MVYDVIVVGAGPAGATVANHLAHQGVHVLVLERKQFPRPKTCGGGLTWKAIRNLPMDISAIVERRAVGGILTYKGELLLKVQPEVEIAWMVRRDRFDDFLIRAAVDAGAEFRQNTVVCSVTTESEQTIVNTKAGKFRARYVVGADGVNSVVARSLGLLPNRKVGIALEAELESTEAALKAQDGYATFDFGALPYGYGWIFPKKDHFSVGVFQAKPGKSPGIRNFLEDFIASQPVLGKSRRVSIQGYHIPLGGEVFKLHNQKAIVVGDAANLADPWLGEGISYAIMSANFAADILSRALQHDIVDLSGYSQRVNKELVSQFRWARRLARIVYSFPYFSSTLLARSSSLQNCFLQTLRGDMTFRHLFAWTSAKFPFILGEALFSHIT